MRERKSKLIIGVLLAAILLLILIPLSFVLVNRPRIPLATLPVPNAYDTLYEAGNMVSGLPDDYADTSDREELESFIATNAEPLKLVEQAIDQQYLLPIDYEACGINIPISHIPLVSGARSGRFSWIVEVSFEP